MAAAGARASGDRVKALGTSGLQRGPNNKINLNNTNNAKNENYSIAVQFSFQRQKLLKTHDKKLFS